MVGDMILSQLNFLVNFSLVGTKCLLFLFMIFLFLFRILYNCGWLFYGNALFAPKILFISNNPNNIFLCEIFGKEWVVLQGLRVSVTNEFCKSKGLTEGRFVQSWQLKNFSAGEIPFSLGCEFKNNKARYSSCWSYFAFFKVSLTVWIDHCTKPLDWW